MFLSKKRKRKKKNSVWGHTCIAEEVGRPFYNHDCMHVVLEDFRQYPPTMILNEFSIPITVLDI